MYKTRIVPWYIPPSMLERFKEQFAHWFDECSGFVLVERTLDEHRHGAYLSPDGTRYRFSPSTRLVPAHKGDIQLILHIDDIDKARNTVESYTDTPCFLAVDAIRYNGDMDYSYVVDKFNDNLEHYFFIGRPKSVREVSYEERHREFMLKEAGLLE